MLPCMLYTHTTASGALHCVALVPSLLQCTALYADLSDTHTLISDGALEAISLCAATYTSPCSICLGCEPEHWQVFDQCQH